ncbi:hypothetical protein PanWU01x14_213570 [Parasponia andersonii]|uniref:Uncharacterized protein n=1 Tax=Parasponia andersonii TaxID=3476 RepID=A0A2P5BSK2_PARAD|nr:hypothetical protein PanWU01x14_213570 [Parasponia andersonii]
MLETYISKTNPPPLQKSYRLLFLLKPEAFTKQFFWRHLILQLVQLSASSPMKLSLQSFRLHFDSSVFEERLVYILSLLLFSVQKTHLQILFVEIESSCRA